MLQSVLAVPSQPKNDIIFYTQQQEKAVSEFA